MVGEREFDMRQLSSTICKEIITLMDGKVQAEIINRFQEMKYDSISVGSSPDEVHIEQMIVCIGYMKRVEVSRTILDFYPKLRPHREEIPLFQFLKELNIHLHVCRG